VLQRRALLALPVPTPLPLKSPPPPRGGCRTRLDGSGCVWVQVDVITAHASAATAKHGLLSPAFAFFRSGARTHVLLRTLMGLTPAAHWLSHGGGGGDQRWVTLRARGVTRRARWVTLRARWVSLRARWVSLRARWVTLRARCDAKSIAE
jgi:hypothetical protein